MNNNSLPVGPDEPEDHALEAQPPLGGGNFYLTPTTTTESNVKSQIRYISKHYHAGITVHWHDNLLEYAQHMRSDSTWVTKWHWNEEFLYDSDDFQPGDLRQTRGAWGKYMLDYIDWFEVLDRQQSETNLVQQLLWLCYEFQKTSGMPAAGPDPAANAHIPQANPYTITSIDVRPCL